MIPRDLAFRIERLIGAKVESYTPVAGGYSPALRLLCHTATASFFAKIGTTPLTSQFLRREIHIYTSVSGTFMPKLVAWEDHASAPILVIEDLSAAQWPPPWDARRVELVLAQIHAMHRTQVSLTAEAQGLPGVRGANWPDVAADPAPFLSLGLADAQWLERALSVLIRSEAQCSPDGESLTHWDLRSDNMCLTAGRAIFVDWNFACIGNPTLDLGFWLPSPRTGPAGCACHCSAGVRLFRRPRRVTRHRGCATGARRATPTVGNCSPLGGSGAGLATAGHATRRVITRAVPNKAVEPTPYSVRYASASGRGSPRALGNKKALYEVLYT
jgi:thiamine kinase-like enzyme